MQASRWSTAADLASARPAMGLIAVLEDIDVIRSLSAATCTPRRGRENN
jgi:hypothetical protein